MADSEEDTSIFSQGQLSGAWRKIVNIIESSCQFLSRAHIRPTSVIYILVCVTVMTLLYVSFVVNSITVSDKVVHIQMQKPYSHSDTFEDPVKLSRVGHSSNHTEIRNHSKVPLHANVSISSKPKRLFDCVSCESFSLIMQTFNLSDILIRVLHHYCAIAHLDRVIVIWNNIGQPPPVDKWERLGPHSVPVRFIVQTKNKMRNRLQPFPEIQTAGA